MKVTQMPPVHAANLVATSGNTAYRVDVIVMDLQGKPLNICFRVTNINKVLRK